jgi:hypothetical protein
VERGTVKTSAIFIAADGRTKVYRTLEEVPPPLRKRLVDSTHGLNSATILIADRRGAQELLRVKRNLLRLRQLAANVPRRPAWNFLRWPELLFAGAAGAVGAVVWLLLWKLAF